MTKLWTKKKNSIPLLEAFMAGDDLTTDLALLPYDITASMAHAEGLAKIGILSAREAKMIMAGLQDILAQSKQGKIKITPADEDCHTVIEKLLTKRYGNVGKKIHTGRSRNDQVLVAIRLYMKEKLLEVEKKTEKLIIAFEKKAQEYKNTPMPGYTHMQRAMQSSASIWFGSFADALEDDLLLLKSTLKVIDQNPLGSVVGYGEQSLGLDRKFTAQKLGFAKVQKNPLYCAMSRGKFELLALQSLQPIMVTLGKFSTDALLFSTKEFGFLSLPEAFTTGSSAMPQKRNYDVLELMRAHASMFGARTCGIASLIANLPSGYNRDFQLSKKPLIEGFESAIHTIAVATLVVSKVILDKDALKAACTPELDATEEAYRLVKEKNMPFRDAYHFVAKKYLGNHKKKE